MEPIRLVNVSKSYGAARIIDDLSLEVAGNELVVFLGASGCGKSTLLRLIAGLESLDAGEIHVGRTRIDRLPPGERSVAMVFQHYALYPHMSVRENLSFGLRNAGLPKAAIASRVAAAAGMLEIGELLDRKPGQISGGQRQRVAIGRAIVKEPKVFLFDEPLSNLDAALRLRTRMEIAQLHRRVKAATIFVTHDQVEAMTLADRIVLLNRQRIEQVGTPMEIYNRPATEFVATFVGTPPMNLVPAAIETHEQGRAVVRLPDGTTIRTRIGAGSIPDGAALKLGARAEGVSIVAPEAGDTRGDVTFIERLGDRTHAHVAIGGDVKLVAEDDGQSRIALGETVGLQFDPGRLHLFDATRGYHPDEAG